MSQKNFSRENETQTNMRKKSEPFCAKMVIWFEFAAALELKKAQKNPSLPEIVE